MTNQSPAVQPSTSIPLARGVRTIRRPVQMFLFVLIGLCLFFIVGYVQRQQQLAAVEVQIEVAEARVVDAQQQQAELLVHKQKIDDPKHVAELARDVLGMIQPGDQPIVLLDAPAPLPTPAARAAPVPVSVPEAQPVWRQWVDVVLGRAP